MDKKNYLVTVIEHGENTDMHARKLGFVKTLAEGQQLINEDKKAFANGLMSSTREEDAITEHDFNNLNPHEIWYGNDFTNGRVYDIFEIV